MSTKEKTLAEILADLQEYLSGDECVDPIGYLETLELWLLAAITRLDSRELGIAVESRTWSLPPEPGPEVTRLRDADGTEWTRSGGLWEIDDEDVGGYEFNTAAWGRLLVEAGPLTDATPTGEDKP